MQQSTASMQVEATAGATDDSRLPTISADTLGRICAYISPLDLLAVACTCSSLHIACNEVLSCRKELLLNGTKVSPARLMWLLKQRLKGKVEQLEVDGCTQLNKVVVIKAVHDCTCIKSLSVRAVGKGSWVLPTLQKLILTAPPTLGSIDCDVRIVLNTDLTAAVGLAMHLAACPALRVRRLVVHRDAAGLVTAAMAAQAAAVAAQPAAMAAQPAAVAAQPAAVAAQPAAVAAQPAAAAAQPAAAASTEGDGAAGVADAAWVAVDVINGDAPAPIAQQPIDVADAAGAPPAPPAPPPAVPAASMPLSALAGTLISRRELWELDGSSGSLGHAHIIEHLVVPLLSAPSGCALRWLACSDISAGGLAALTRALAHNNSLTTLKLGCNTIHQRSAGLLADALMGHVSLTSLTLEHNPICDSGSAAIATTLSTNVISHLSLAFTGAGDATCAAIATALDARSPLKVLSLCGNSVSSIGLESLVGALERRGPSGPFRALNLSANAFIRPDAIRTLARALPHMPLRTLELAGCGITAQAVGMLAAMMPQCTLAHIDLSSNHFKCEGAWGLAWAIAESACLRTLNLSDCAIGDDGGDELAEALNSPVALAAIVRLDLRGNKIAPGHPLEKDKRAVLAFQRPAELAR